jgi:hypothetical protein
MSRRRKQQYSRNPFRDRSLLRFITSGGCVFLHLSITGFGSREESRDSALGR